MNVTLKIRGLIFVIAQLVLVSCASHKIQRKIASTDIEPMTEEARKIYDNLLGKAKDIEPADIGTAILQGVEHTEDAVLSVKNSRLVGLMIHSVVVHTIEALDASIALYEGRKLTEGEQSSMISIPAAAVITVAGIRPLINYKIPFLSKWKRGVRSMGKKGRFVRMPTFAVRMALLLVAYSVTDAGINVIADSALEADIGDVKELRELLKEVERKAAEQAEII